MKFAANNKRSENKETLKRVASCRRNLFNQDMMEKKGEDLKKLTWNVMEKQYGTVLSGFLKTRNIILNNKDNKKFIFRFKTSSWKLRYWSLRMTDETGLIFEKSRRPDTRPYKSIILPFNETTFWENWGKRGDSKYCFGFTLRVGRDKLQMDVAVDSDQARLQWLNVLELVFRNNVRTVKELLKCLNDKEPSLQSTKSFESGKALKMRNFNGGNTGSISSHSFETVVCTVQSPVIPRRFCSDVYDDDGHMSDILERNRSFYFRNILPKIVDKELESREDENDFWDGSNQILTTEHEINDSLPPLSKECMIADLNIIGTSSCRSLPGMITPATKDLIAHINDIPATESVFKQNSAHLSENILNILSGVNQISGDDKQQAQLASPSPSSFTLAQKIEDITSNNNNNICNANDVDMRLNVIGHESTKENSLGYNVGVVVA